MANKDDLKIGDIGEFEFIRSITDGCRFSSEKLIKGIGDDCAVIGPYENKVFLVTTDLLVEDVHVVVVIDFVEFTLCRLSGYKRYM